MPVHCTLRTDRLSGDQAVVIFREMLQALSIRSGIPFISYSLQCLLDEEQTHRATAVCSLAVFYGYGHGKAHAVRSVPHLQGEEALSVAGRADAPLDQDQDVSVP